MRTLKVAVVVGVVAVAGLTGCGHRSGGEGGDAGGAGDIPDNQVFIEYRPQGNRYSIKVPEGWARTETADSATFTDKLNTITVVLGSRSAAPDVAAGTADLAAMASGTPGFSPGNVSLVRRSAGQALLVTYRADAPPDPVTGKVVNDDVERYQFWQNQALLTVTLAGPHGADNVDPWRTVTDSVRWLP